MYNSSGVHQWSSLKTYLIDGQESRFRCETSGIYPAASFMWTLGGLDLAPSNGSDVMGADALIYSTSIVSLMATNSMHGEVLVCLATNHDDQLGVATNVTFYVAGIKYKSVFLVHSEHQSLLVCR